MRLSLEDPRPQPDTTTRHGVLCSRLSLSSSSELPKRISAGGSQRPNLAFREIDCRVLFMSYGCQVRHLYLNTNCQSCQMLSKKFDFLFSIRSNWPVKLTVQFDWKSNFGCTLLKGFRMFGFSTFPLSKLLHRASPSLLEKAKFGLWLPLVEMR